MNMLEVSARLRAGEAIPVKEQMKLVVSLSVPAILEQLVMTLMSYIDTAMVGGLGYQATAAIGVVASSIWFMNAFVNAAAIGFSVQVAQYLGAGDGKGPFLINLCSMWGIRVVTVLLFTRQFGVLGVWATMAVELICRGIFFLIRLLRGRWIQVGALK
ncbi:MATE family efflux transporter [Laedolimicola sp.]|uniref:MATE family efflux transporter n=1 Tax=Laedolimicola sp. TaxID=2981663 RepID=UPI003F80EB71